MSSKLIGGGTIIRSTTEVQADILVEDGLIKEIIETKNKKQKTKNESPEIDEVIDASGFLIFPGLIDCHVHFREPGYGHKATMKSESAAARAGGVTTVCEMPNTDPPAVTVEAFEDKVRRAQDITDCDIRFFFGITEEVHIEELKKVWAAPELKGRCAGVKLYLEQSTGNQKVEGGIVEEIFKVCVELKIPLIAHCEDPEINATATAANTSEDISAYSAMRPPESEAESIEYAISLVRKHGTQLHIAHLSTKQGIDLVAQAKKEGLPVTCEVTPHHLFFSTDDYGKLGTLGKMNPPLRSNEHVDALWKGIAEGTVDCVATDHAPHTLEEKQVEPSLSAPSGVPGVETMIPLLLTAASEGKISYTDIVRLCFNNPNSIFSLGKRGIVEGAPAGIVIVDPEKKWIIKGAELHYKCGWTPFEGWEVRGKVVGVL